MFISASPIGAEKFANSKGVYSTIAFYIILENPRSSNFYRSPIGAAKFCSANRRDFSQIRMEKKRRGSAYFVNNLVHVCLPTLEPIRAALTSQDLSFDTKLSPSQSRVTLPLSNTYFFLVLIWSTGWIFPHR